MSICHVDVHGMSLCDVVLFLYALCESEWLYDEGCWNEWGCLHLICWCMNWMIRFVVMNGLLSMCGVMGFHTYIALLKYYWGHEQGLVMIYVMWSHYMCKLL